MRLPKLIRPTTGVLVLPLFHLLMCIVVQLYSILQPPFVHLGEPGWVWSRMFFIDLPLSALLVHIHFLPGFIFFGIFGTLWWYFIGVIIRVLLTWHPPMSD